MDAAVLKKVALFEGLTQGQLAKVAQIGHSRTYPAGAFLFREGETGQEMFVIAEGKVRISKSVPGIGEEALAILEPASISVRWRSSRIRRAQRTPSPT